RRSDLKESGRDRRDRLTCHSIILLPLGAVAPLCAGRHCLNHFAAACLVQDETLERVERAAPRGLLERFHRMAITGFAALPNALGTKVDVLRVILKFERGCKQWP